MRWSGDSDLRWTRHCCLHAEDRDLDGGTLVDGLSGIPSNETSVGDKGITLLEEARALEGTLHHSGVRDGYRKLLEQGIVLVMKALEEPRENAEHTRLRKRLVDAHAALAEDARYGVGALSRSAQRAPTLRDCEDGWLKVAGIVDNAWASAREARCLANIVGGHRSTQLASRAERAARSAEDTLQARNKAYTFFTTPSFSFGEGWYLAAASLFDSLLIQVESGTPQEAQALQFLCDVGLRERLVPYRSRPASPKHLTDIIAATFRRDPLKAQAQLRRAFLGEQPAPVPIIEWLSENVGTDTKEKVLLWVRASQHDTHRNTSFIELAQLAQLLLTVGVTPVYYGDAMPSNVNLQGGIDLTLCWKTTLFQGPSMRRAQLQLFEELRQRHRLIGQIGVTTAGMDGPALMGLPTAYLTDAPNVRLGKWVGNVPGYVEVPRHSGYRDKLRGYLQNWRSDRFD
jgi:hypothetical protein